MSERPKRLATRPDYRQLSDVKLPRNVPRSSKRYKASSDTTDTKLYRLRVLEEDEENGRVKVGYIGFSNEYDEWRRLEDIVNIEEEDEEEDNDYLAPSSRLKFCLFEELACQIKTLLFSSRKASPVCSLSMSFDRVHFDSLVMRGIRKESKGRKEVYSLVSLSKLDDLLGERWYIRGINEAGDFCYVEPGTVSFYLRQSKPKPDFQLKDDGTLAKRYFGMQSQLVFQFVRNDGTSRQWNSVLQSCI